MNKGNGMTATSPEQMRARADDLDSKGHHWSGQPAHDFFEAATALRAAADQLEADAPSVAAIERDLLTKDVDFWIRQADKFAAQIAAIERVADMAEDDEDGNGWVPVGPLLDALYPEKRGVSDD